MIEVPAIPETAQPLCDALLECASAAASWDVVHRPATRGTFPARLRAARRALKALEADVALLQPSSKSGGNSTSALFELRANARLFRAALRAASDRPQIIARLPRVVCPARKDEPRAAAIASVYLRAVDGKFSAPAFRDLIHALQAHDPLTLDELWNASAFLKFTLLELLLEDARLLMRSPGSAPGSSVAAHLKSLRTVTHTDWAFLMEPLILFDATLRQDPAQAYASMDFDSREFYRKRVALIARHSDCTESQVAQAALDLAREGAAEHNHDLRMQRRRTHVGYYLFDKGFPQLAARTAFHPPLIERARALVRTQADSFYITGIELITIVFIAVLIVLPLPRFSLLDWIVAALMLLMPAMQCAVDLINNAVTFIFDPAPLPKLDFSKGIPAECATLVTVPSLLLNEAQVRGLVNDLEVHFLANHDAHLHFALLTDLPDSASKPHSNDAHPLVALAIQLIDDLNAKHGSPNSGGFILLHRHRIFNVRQGYWMGWERKRGKLLDLNRLLSGEFDAFPIKAGRLGALSQIRYVLTLDSDTQLPRGAAARLIGAIAHPLHQAVIHPRLRIVTDGYGILQPRIGISVRSASRSRLAAIYSGQSGFDIYTRAISDAYQDLYGEGIFTGKGIYEVATLHAVLNDRFPRNALLSHDLIEGAYARAGLASDVELIDDYPSHLIAYNRRKHRWVRGDWQIAQWMFSRVPEESGRWAPNPISEVSRWKIFDNLRRSLVEPFTFILFAAGWLGLPGGPLYWTIVPLILLIFPGAVQCAFGLGRAFVSGRKGSAGEVLSGFWKTALIALLNLIFLPHQALLCLDAIVRALVRRFITGERLLEWETAAEAEIHPSRCTPIDRYIGLTPAVALAVATVVYLMNPRHHHALVVAAPILLLWALAPLVTARLNAPLREQHKRLDSRDQAFLLAHALRIWRYFRQFGSEIHNYLIPDNVEEAGLYEAARVSPTNLGLLLNARQAACDFGFLTVPEFAALTNRSLATIARLEKFRGHLYNWYDTHTLEPLGESSFVSSVDSGNLVASLYTLRSGAVDLLRGPLLARQLFSGIRTHWQMMRSEGILPANLSQSPLPAANVSIDAWLAWLSSTQAAFAAASGPPTAQHQDFWWLTETGRRVDAILEMLEECLPWLLPEYAPLREILEPPIRQSAYMLTIDEAIAFAENLSERLTQALPAFADYASMLALGERLQASLPRAAQNLRSMAASLHGIAQQAERLVQEAEFAFLADPGRGVLSIGYDVRAQKLHEACYDMIASEARIATFLAIARDEVPKESWFKLGREHTRAFGRFLLLSWTGTMFEYLMPALWMRSYPETLISRTLAACVYVQRAFARSLKIPWGISESGASRRDHMGHYHYQAYSVPQIALWIEATAGPVVSPYSSFLALAVDSVASLRNLRRMDSAGWVGAFGFYEAADYSSTSGKPVLVREWMAHHQGMSLLAILNLLHDNVVQRWFHANPEVQATELLLHEMPVSKPVLRARLKE
ncbi:MAG: glucoamylase family protein [Terracidiphilus sp.]